MRYLKWLFIICIFLGKSLSACAQNNIKFYNLSIKQGLSQSTVHCVLQDRKGFMWFGTQDGLNQYDGYNFNVFYHNPIDSNSISDNIIHCLYEDKKGDIWIGTEQGLNRFNRATQTFTHFVNIPGTTNSLLDNSVWAICEDSRGILWIGTDEGGLNSFDRKKKTFMNFQNNYTPVYSFCSNSIRSIFEDKTGNLWIGTRDEGVNKYNPFTQQFTRYRHSETNSNTISNNTVWTICQDKYGFIWMGTNDGLNRFNDKRQQFQVFKNSYYGINNNIIRSLYPDKTGVLWIGTGGGGLNKFEPKKFVFTSYEYQPQAPTGLSSNNILSIYEDRTGTVWLGTDGGINKFDRRKQNFLHYQHIATKQNTINNDVVLSILQGRNGTIWMGTEEGLNKFDNESQQFINFKYPPQSTSKSIFTLCEDKYGVLWLGMEEGVYLFNPSTEKFSAFQSNSKLLAQLKDKRINSIIEDHQDNIWVGTRDGLYKISRENDKITPYFVEFGNVKSLSSNFIRVVYEDAHGNIWIGTNGGGLDKIIPASATKPETVVAYKFKADSEKSIGNNTVLAILEDKSGLLWLGTNGGGLNSFNPKSLEFSRYTIQQGLASNVVYGILADKNENIWVSTNKSISKLNKASHTFRNYEEYDGIMNNGFNPGACCMSKRGEFFFGGINGVNAFYPEKLIINPLPPKLVLTNFEIFYKPVKIGKGHPLRRHISIADEVILGARDNVFSFTFAALHYTLPERNQYAYKMENFDEEWNFSGTRRVAPYTNLDPGEYTFRVKGSNSDGIWDDKGISIKVIVKPPYWKTWWFRILLAAGILGCIYAWNRSRIKGIEEQKNLLERQVTERTAEVILQKKELELQRDALVTEKSKSDNLLLNILPAETAEELKTRGKSAARHYRMVSVLFTDFRGFTGFAENMRPNDLISELDRCFLYFDDITEKYNIEKIKTIGDSYMCAGGIPIRNRSNPVDAVLAGLAIKKTMEDIKKEKEANGELYWDIRIGIHTGELIAGVVGKKKFAYDIWGDTVNTASRMESAGEINKVNISGATYEKVKDYFECTYRGKIAVKSKGDIDMYFVNNILPELSIDGLGLIPNELFKQKLSNL
jgi:ligand-binding sensor domain-containing protein/class 3 adenylate cyclase